MIVDSDAAIEFLRTAFEPDDRIAIFLKSYESGQTAQRVGPLARFLAPRFHAWLRAMNAQRFNCYVSVNAIRPGVHARTKDAIGAVRHLFLEADDDGWGVLARVCARPDLPEPSYVLESSPNRVHMFWRVEGFTTGAIERLQKYLATEVGTDPAATACSQTARLPGYLNHKRAAHLVTVTYCSSERYPPAGFPASPPLPALPSSATPRSRVRGELDVIERARRYLAKVDPAVSGQHGDLHTFRVCCRVVRGFALAEHEAFTLLSEWNARCQPPWSEQELRDKMARAAKYGREPVGRFRSDT